MSSEQLGLPARTEKDKIPRTAKDAPGIRRMIPGAVEVLLAPRRGLELGKLSDSPAEEKDSMTVVNQAVGVASPDRGGNWSLSTRSEGPRQANTLTNVDRAVKAASPERHFDGRRPSS